MANDWQPKRNKIATQVGKSRFDINALIGIWKPDIPGGSVSHYAFFFDGFGVRKGREVLVGEIVKNTSLESLLGIIRREKAFTFLWTSDERKNLFASFKGKKLTIALDFTQFTPGNGVATHHKLTLFNAKIRDILPDYRIMDKKATKVERINGRFGEIEFETL